MCNAACSSVALHFFTAVPVLLVLPLLLLLLLCCLVNEELATQQNAKLLSLLTGANQPLRSLLLLYS